MLHSANFPFTLSSGQAKPSQAWPGLASPDLASPVKAWPDLMKASRSQKLPKTKEQALPWAGHCPAYGSAGDCSLVAVVVLIPLIKLF